MNKIRYSFIMGVILTALIVVSGAAAESWTAAEITPIGSERMEGTISKGIQPDPSIVDGLGDITEEDWTIGPEDAAMKILMYSDFECPYCSLAGLALLEYQAKHPDDVLYVYRHFPLPYHTKAPMSAWAANAAGKQDEKLFFAVEHLLYAAQSDWARFETLDEYESWLKDQMAKVEGLDLAQWEKDYADETMRTKLSVDFDKASATGLIAGTPTIFLNMNSFRGGWEAATLDNYLAYFKLQKDFYRELPPIVIDGDQDYRAVVETTQGSIVFDLLEKEAPLAVNSFVFLANEGWYDGNPFYRVKEGFIAETGDPAGNGMGNPGYLFANDVNGLSYGEAGLVGLVNGGKDKNGSKFFFTNDLNAFYKETISALNDQAKEESKLSDAEIEAEIQKEIAKLTESYPIFGKVVEGVELIPALTTEDAILSVRIEVKSE